MARIREHFCSLIGAQPLLFGLSLADCTPRIPAAFTVHGIHNHTRVGSAHACTHTRIHTHRGGHSRSNATDTRRGHRVHTCHTIQREVRRYMHSFRVRARVNAIVDVRAYMFARACVLEDSTYARALPLQSYDDGRTGTGHKPRGNALLMPSMGRKPTNQGGVCSHRLLDSVVCLLGPGTFPETYEHGDGRQPIPLVWRT